MIPLPRVTFLRDRQPIIIFSAYVLIIEVPFSFQFFLQKTRSTKHNATYTVRSNTHCAGAIARPRVLRDIAARRGPRKDMTYVLNFGGRGKNYLL